MLPFIFSDLPIQAQIIMAFFIPLVLSLAFGTPFINLLRRKQGKGQPIREDGPQSHLLTKKGTPTMGGLMILGTSIIGTLICANLNNPFIWISIAVLLVYGFVGFVDDYVKVTKQTSNAMTAKMKLLLQFSTALIATLIISHFTPEEFRYQITIPFFPILSINLIWLYIPFAMVVITGSSNAVNLSDGLDGLASKLLITAFSIFVVLTVVFSSYLDDTHVKELLNFSQRVQEMFVLCVAVIGALFGFLWFNTSPAKVFMGDTGSLALGAFLGTFAIMIKHEVILVIVGGVFVVEALSTMIQIFYFKKTGGKRFFKMAPIHHHFEQIGWAETTVVTRFWIISIILGIIGLMLSSGYYVSCNIIGQCPNNIFY